MKTIVGFFLLLFGAMFILAYLAPPTVWLPNGHAKELSGNIGAELIGIAITVLIIDALNELRQKQQLKEQLIREMASQDNGLALRAVVEITAHGWLTDGSLKSANLRKANLQEANFINAYLCNVDFEKANLSRATFREANLEKANLSGAILEGSFFRGANLHLASLAGTNLRGATLQKADLEGVVLDGAQYNNLTQWPEGFDPTRSGAIMV